MQILALECELPAATIEAFQRLAQDEARMVWDLHQAGLIRELYFRPDQPTAILVLECNSVEEARSILADLPMVREGLITFSIIPLKASQGFERLFKVKR